MKKQNLIIILAVSFANALFAQTGIPNNSAEQNKPHSEKRQMANGTLTNNHFQHHANTVEKTTTGNASRCIAQVYYHGGSGSYSFGDSITFTYTGTMSNYKCDSGKIYNYNGSSYSNSERFFQTFDTHKNIISSYSKSWITYLGIWRNIYQSAYTYDASNNMLTEIDQNWDTVANTWVNANKYIYTYDGSNNLLSEVSQYWNTSTWVSSYKYVYTYTSYNAISTETIMQWSTPMSNWGWDSSKYFSTYDGSQNKIKEIYLGWDSTSHNWLIDTIKYVYTYDGSNNCLTMTHSNYNGTNWTNDYKYVYSSFTGNHHPQQIIYQYWHSWASSFVNNFAEYRTFNSYDQITYDNNKDWDSSSATFVITPSDYVTKYYYEEYYNKVPTIAKPIGGTINLYPIPAKSNLFIDIIWDEAQPFNISIYDIQGRLHSQTQLAAMAHYSENMDISQLQPGNYIIKAEGANGGKIVKEIVIE